MLIYLSNSLLIFLNQFIYLNRANKTEETSKRSLIETTSTGTKIKYVAGINITFFFLNHELVIEKYQIRNNDEKKNVGKVPVYFVYTINDERLEVLCIFKCFSQIKFDLDKILQLNIQNLIHRMT